MGNKTLKKRAAFQRFCREQVKKGLINGPDGGWVSYDAGRAMHRDCWYGYKLGQTGKKKGSKQGEDVDA